MITDNNLCAQVPESLNSPDIAPGKIPLPHDDSHDVTQVSHNAMTQMVKMMTTHRYTNDKLVTTCKYIMMLICRAFTSSQRRPHDLRTSQLHSH